MDIGQSRFPNNRFNNWFRHQTQANAVDYQNNPQDNNYMLEDPYGANIAQTEQCPKPKGSYFNCGINGHFARDCRKPKNTRVNYMDIYEGKEQIPQPTMKPRTNIAHLKAQIDMLSP